MIVLETGFELDGEAFIERRFTRGVNIFFSDDNNKGKTLLLQGLMYSLGNEPIFPSGFNYRSATFYSKCEFNGVEWSFLRRYSVIITFGKGKLRIFDSISEFKYFYDSEIAALPTISKDGKKKLVDFSLLYQLFFLPQDKRNSSDIFHPGYYKKGDFIELIYALTGSSQEAIDITEIEDLKSQLTALESDKKSLEKRMSFSKRHPEISRIANKSSDLEYALMKRKAINDINFRISELDRERTREYNRRSKLERLKTELNSLNHELSSGKVHCGECGSTKITYKNDEFEFDASNSIVRNEIIGSILYQIKIKDEIIEEKTRLINLEQDSLNNELKTIPLPVIEIIQYKEEIASSNEIDALIIDADAKIAELKNRIEQSKQAISEDKANGKKIISRITDEMNRLYKEFDPSGYIVFGDIFSPKDMIYSGSQEQEYFLVKLLALNNILKHDFPIIIDSFRSGELSTKKENTAITLFTNIKKQVIISSTLKFEEYDVNHYSPFFSVNVIDYSTHQNSHILSNQYTEEFKAIVKHFSVI